MVDRRLRELALRLSRAGPGRVYEDWRAQGSNAIACFCSFLGCGPQDVPPLHQVGARPPGGWDWHRGTSSSVAGLAVHGGHRQWRFGDASRGGSLGRTCSGVGRPGAAGAARCFAAGNGDDGTARTTKKKHDEKILEKQPKEKTTGRQPEEKGASTGSSTEQPIDKTKEQEAIDSARLLELLVGQVKEGYVGHEEIIRGLTTGHLTREDLDVLLERGAIDELDLKEIVTEAIGASSMSFFEIMNLVQLRLVGKADLEWLVREGVLVHGDVEFLVKRGLISNDVAEEVRLKTGDVDCSDRVGFSDVLRGVKSGQMSPEMVQHMMLDGFFASDDIQLLVEEGALDEAVADKMLQDSAEEIRMAYAQAEELASVVEEGTINFEELEVMREKGVLGDSLIHYLVSKEALTRSKGRRLLAMRPESAGEVDEGSTSEVVEEPGSSAEAEMQQAFEKMMKEADESSSNGVKSAEEGQKQAEAGTGTSQSEQEVEDDDGFYPKHIDPNDIFALWEHLEKTYKGVPGLPSIEEILQEEAEDKEVKKKKVIEQERMQEAAIEHPKVVDDLGRAYATGKRKCAIARVWVREGGGKLIVNKMPMHEYFLCMDTRAYVLAPLLATGTAKSIDVRANVKGGGVAGQAQALRHGMSRALQLWNPELRQPLRSLGLLTRDAREVERKKPGKAKARKSFQWVKR